ncbi:iron-sulfur cluster biosynthesis transcriptional regulator SufR [Cyanobium sp. NIES-981]|uniref:iron-sulfur cluster biosynthesis transcriptional regulator SufR n=1 Tax=Cyanobium sp. NIES-981 TaxID=1851505 RepID=UPI000B360F28|nr:iron-sulfur cluster biosynthesis transcriptional regulator SufR [Cyanobium sp. NIES-981]
MGSRSEGSGAEASGQAPASSPPPSPGSTREAALALLVRHGEATAAALAKSLGVSVQVMRRHLRSLEEEGLVASCTASDGPGRPTNRWHLTDRGQDQFPDGSEAFALGLLASIAQNLPADTLSLLLAQQGSQQARLYRRQVGDGCLQERLERLVDLRRREGYVAECSPHPDGQSWVIQEFHCSVMRIAEQFPCVCDQELRLIRETFPDCQVERVQWRLEKGHSCGFRLQPSQPG